MHMLELEWIERMVQLKWCDVADNLYEEIIFIENGHRKVKRKKLE